MQKVRIRVEGRVQGVGFRYMTKLVADQLGISGIVRNEADGSVYIEANGEKCKIEKFIQVIRQSPPPSSKVNHCEIQYNDNLPIYTKFDVTY